MKRSITAHCLVKNEARFVWFSVMSVINHVDKVLLWDTGSTDGTVEIIEEILRSSQAKGKVDFLEVGNVNPQEFTTIRQKMLEKTKTDWFLILDGDEIWWEESIKKIKDLIQEAGDSLESIVLPFFDVVGDIYHYQDSSEGMYEIDNHKGHISIRAIKRRIPGLHFAKPHGQQGVFDRNEILIQNRDKKFRKFVDAPYMHFTHVMRSSFRDKDKEVPKRSQKLKYDLGIPFPPDFYYPEVFFTARPEIVLSPWTNRSLDFIIKSAFLFPLRRGKRYLLLKQVGY